MRIRTRIATALLGLAIASAASAANPIGAFASANDRGVSTVSGNPTNSAGFQPDCYWMPGHWKWSAYYGWWFKPGHWNCSEAW